jgi:hypothetical protein
MAQLLNPKLKIESTTGTNQMLVTAIVTVRFSAQEESIIKALNLKSKLKCRLWSDDADPDADNPVFWFATKTISKEDTYTFTRKVSKDTLDEDWEGNDELYAKFALSTEGFSISASAKTPVQVGNY